MDDRRQRLNMHRPIAVLVIAAACLAVLPAASGGQEQPPDQTDTVQPPADDAKDKTPAPPLEPIPTDEIFSILGKGVRGPAGEDMGRVVDLLFDSDAQPRAVVIDFGGFLGVGSRRIAIDWRLLRFEPANRAAPLQLGLGKAEIQAAPEYKDTAKPPMMVGPPPERSDSDVGR
jgi:hypothetical protein